jgi:hypothetical protein
MLSAKASIRHGKITFTQGKKQARVFARRTAYAADSLAWTVRNCFVGNGGRAVFCTAAWDIGGVTTCSQALKVTRHGSRYRVDPRRTYCDVPF